MRQLAVLFLAVLSNGCGVRGENERSDDGRSREDANTTTQSENACFDCAACCYGVSQTQEVSTGESAAIRYVVMTGYGPLGYLVGQDGFLLRVATADPKYMLTINSSTGALIGPEFWHHRSTGRIGECGIDRIFHVSDGPCGPLEGTIPSQQLILSDYADQEGTSAMAIVSSNVAQVTYGELFTYRLGSWSINFDTPCFTHQGAESMTIDDLPEMCGLRVGSAVDLDVARGLVDTFFTNYDFPISVIETTTPVEDL